MDNDNIPDLPSIWLESARARPDAAAFAPPTSDVVVIGGGLAGLCTAMRCIDLGASVTLIEANRIASRTTGHSTAKVTALHGLTYAGLAEKKGPEVAARYAGANTRGLAAIFDCVLERGIECDLVPADAYTCAEHPDGSADIEREVRAASAAGLPVELVTETELPFPIASAVRLPGQGQFDPVAFCLGLAADLVGRGMRLLEGVRVTDVSESSSGCTVTAGSQTLSCDFAVIATHLPIVDPFMLAGRTRPQRSYVVAGPVSTTAPQGMYLSSDAGWSVRTWDGPDGPQVLAGGEGHAMVDHVTSSQHYAQLERWATSKLGMDVRHRWSAFDYMPVDGLPFIGHLGPRCTRRLVATGFRKWGMTTSMVAGMILGDLIDGRTNDDAAIFDATRLVPNLGRDIVTNNAKVAVRFVKDRVVENRPTASDAASAPASASASTGSEAAAGSVVRRGRKMVAVGRAEDGTLSATCTHLGCIVQFNDGEQTWDCPCHGSRFALDGSVIDGPATAPLERIDRRASE